MELLNLGEGRVNGDLKDVNTWWERIKKRESDSVVFTYRARGNRQMQKKVVIYI